MRGRVGIKYQEHAVTGFFIFLLLAVFALLSMLLVIIGARAYRGITESADLNTEHRMATSYIANRLRSSDRSAGITVEQYGDITAIVQHMSVDGAEYETRIYCEDGKLCEQFVSADVAFDPALGRGVSEIARMDVQMESDRMICVTIEQVGGEVETMHVSLRSE